MAIATQQSSPDHVASDDDGEVAVREMEVQELVVEYARAHQRIENELERMDSLFDELRHRAQHGVDA